MSNTQMAGMRQGTMIAENDRKARTQENGFPQTLQSLATGLPFVARELFNVRRT